MFKAPVFLVIASIVLALSISTTATITVNPITARVVATFLFTIILPPVLDIAERFFAHFC